MASETPPRSDAPLMVEMGDTELRVRDDMVIREAPAVEVASRGWRGYIEDAPPPPPLQTVTVTRAGVTVSGGDTQAPIVRTAKDGSVTVRFPDETP